MTEDLVLGFAAIVVLGIAAQWIAWRLKIPSILLLLLLGLLAGPVTGFIEPDMLMGGMLRPFVSLAVAVILFEGGLSLKVSELKATGAAVHRLLTVGAMITWAASAAAARYILALDLQMAVLLGAILVVTGPTVVTPLLRHIRPSERVGSVLRWEGILIDPLGAALAVLVYEAILAGRFQQVSEIAAEVIFKTVVTGGFFGVSAALVLVGLLKKYWVPDYLENPVTLMLVVLSYTLSNLYQAESGLLAVTFMGATLANQKTVPVKHIMEFKENLTVLLISFLFIILAARISPGDLARINLSSLVFLGVLVFAVRPLSVFVSMIGSELDWREKAFVALLAPRGIVAAAVSSVFAIEMLQAGIPGAAELMPVTFLVIIGTVAFYGIGGSLFARALKVSEPGAMGFLILGGHSWAVAIGKTLMEAGFKVVVVDTNPAHAFSARMAGLKTYYGSGISEEALQNIELTGIGRLLAMTPNSGVNSLAGIHFSDVFDRSELYQLIPDAEEKKREKEFVSKHLHGRYLFSEESSYGNLTRRFSAGAAIKRVNLTKEFDYEAFLARYPSATPLFLINEAGELSVFTVDHRPVPRPGHTLISIVDEADSRGASQELKKKGES